MSTSRYMHWLPDVPSMVCLCVVLLKRTSSSHFPLSFNKCLFCVKDILSLGHIAEQDFCPHGDHCLVGLTGNKHTKKPIRVLVSDPKTVKQGDIWRVRRRGCLRCECPITAVTKYHRLNFLNYFVFVLGLHSCASFL